MKMKRKSATSGSTPAVSATPVTTTTPATSAISWFTQATIILALIPFIGYWCGLALEQGFFSYFGIPDYFISLNPTLVLSDSTILLMLGFALLLLIVLGILLSILLTHIKEIKIKPNLIIKICMFSFLSSLIVLVIYRAMKSSTHLFIYGFLISSIIISFLFYNYYREGILGNLFLIIFFTGVLSMALICGFIFFREEGRMRAENRDEFPVFDPSSYLGMQSQEVAVLRMYGEYVYAVPFNRDTKEFDNKLIIVKISDIKIPLSFEKIGPLRAKP